MDDPVLRRIGEILGTADIIAQMSDRCYLEKCHDRLYPEFVLGGIARRKRPDGQIKVIYKSGKDLLSKTPAFYVNAMKRLSLPREDLIFLGYPDGGLEKMWQMDGSTAYRQMLTQKSETYGLVERDYHSLTHAQPAPYVKASVVADLVEILTDESMRNPIAPMPSLGRNHVLSRTEIEQIIDFLYTL